MQSSYKSWSLLYFYNKPLDKILKLIRLKENNSFIEGKLSFKNEINIKNLNFSYKNNNYKISKNINLTLKKGKMLEYLVGLVVVKQH